jgi:SSS family solute:Na+ symporter
MKSFRIARLLTLFLIIYGAALQLYAKDDFKEQIRWEVVGSLKDQANPSIQKGVAGPLVGFHQNVMIIAGGANFPNQMPWEGGVKRYYNEIFIAKKEGEGKLKMITAGERLPVELAYSGCVSLPQGIVCVGGETRSGPSGRVFLISKITDQDKVRITQLPELPIPLTSLTVVSDGSTVYAMGGISLSGPSAKVFALDLSINNPSWQTLPDLPVALSHASAAIQSNGQYPCIYLMGGRSRDLDSSTTFFNHTLRYDPVKREWKELGSIKIQGTPMFRAAGAAFPTGANYIILVGGDDGIIFNNLEELDAQIAVSDDPSVKQSLQSQKQNILLSHPGFNRNVLLYNTITDVWTTYGSLPMDAPVTTQAVKWGSEIFIPSGEIKPGVRTPDFIRATIEKSQFFSWIDSAVLLVCFLLMTFGRYAFTGRSDTTNDYFKGGQRIPQWAAAVSIFGAKLSAITFIGIPAKTYATNWTYFCLQMTIVMVMPFVIKYFIPFYRRLNVTSAYEYLSNRFNETTRMIASSLYIFLQLGRMGIVVLLPSIALTLVTGIDVNICILIIGSLSIFFTVKGGIEAVIWVEVIQVMILALGAIICIIFIPFQLNDWQGGIDALTRYEKLKVFDFRMDFTEPTFWVVIVGGLAIQLLTYGTDQTTVQRYLTTKTEKESINSLKIGAWLTVPSTIIFFTIGTLLFLLFREQPNQVNISFENQDNIFPWFIVSQLPAGLSGLLIAGIFAASMSSAEASMNSTATLLTTDFFKKWNPNADERVTLKFARWTTFILGLFTTGIALYMAYVGVSSLWDTFNTVLGLFTGCIGGAFLLGIFTKKANSHGVVLGMIISGFVQILIHKYTNVHLLLYAFTGLVSCVVVGYILSLFFKNNEVKA